MVPKLCKISCAALTISTYPNSVVRPSSQYAITLRHICASIFSLFGSSEWAWPFALVSDRLLNKFSSFIFIFSQLFNNQSIRKKIKHNHWSWKIPIYSSKNTEFPIEFGSSFMISHKTCLYDSTGKCVLIHSKCLALWSLFNSKAYLSLSVSRISISPLNAFNFLHFRHTFTLEV